jgi:hypothetical protein
MMLEFSDIANALCFYISMTPDPVAGGYFAYEFATPNFPDYPKVGVWPDGYYVSTNEASPAAYAMDRVNMLAGLPATAQRFTAPNMAGFPFQALLPSDLDGPNAPPPGAPNYFIRHRDDEAHNPGFNDPAQDFLEIFEFSVDFATPANSTFTGPNIIAISEFDSDLCGLVSFDCFPQPAPGPDLDPLREVVMWRLQYRNTGAAEVMVGNLVTDVDGSDHGGIRWFELNKAGPSWALDQEGTYAPDENHRWMGSIATDKDGNISLGYSVSNSNLFPGIRYTGRSSTDPPGTLPIAEVSVIAGSSHSNSNRWGDYSSMNVDPADDCTFWYTNLYGSANAWATQITVMKFDSCGAPPHACCNTGGPGCIDSEIEAAICAVDAYCCETAWDSICVGEVTTIVGDNCDCCLVSSSAEGCFEPDLSGNGVSDCVCAADPFCCEVVWDSLCVDEVESLGCGTCSGCGAPPMPGSPTPVDGATNQSLDQDLFWSAGPSLDLRAPPVIEAAPRAFERRAAPGFSFQSGVLMEGESSVSLSGGGEAAAVAALATLIDFDDLAQPCNFNLTTHLTSAYSAMGVLFVGPGGNDGGAILDECSNFSVTGYSSPNFLAFNPTSSMSDGGIPRPPETIQFPGGATQVQALVGSGDPTLAGILATMIAYDTGGAVVDSSSVELLPAVTPLSVSGDISYVEVDVGGPGAWVLDDLSFEPAPDCTPSYDVRVGLTEPPTGLACSGVTTPLTCDPGLLPHSDTIYWRVISSNPDGSTPGPVWSFGTCADDDGDGVCNEVDNCPGDYNPDQSDTDLPIVVAVRDEFVELAPGVGLIASGPIEGENLEFSCERCADASFLDAVPVIGNGFALCGYNFQVPRSIIANGDPLCGRSTLDGTLFELQLRTHRGFDDCFDAAEGAHCAAVGGETSFGGGDGVGDVCDNCPTSPNPNQEDLDGDEAGDVCDNCSDRANPNQIDTNQDGYGNVCDPDLNNDGVVGIPDFNVFRSAFSETCGDPGYDPDADFNSDCAVGIPDFNTLRTFFGFPPGPSGYACAGAIPCP